MLEKFEYKKATIEDIDELVRTRIMVLRAANKLSDDVDMSVVEKESYAYYKRALENGEHIAYLVYDNGTFIGAFRQKSAKNDNIQTQSGIEYLAKKVIKKDFGDGHETRRKNIS